MDGGGVGAFDVGVVGVLEGLVVDVLGVHVDHVDDLLFPLLAQRIQGIRDFVPVGLPDGRFDQPEGSTRLLGRLQLLRTDVQVAE